MKRYVVLSKIGFFNATAVREFDDVYDAMEYQALMQKSEDNERVTYFVAEVKLLPSA